MMENPVINDVYIHPKAHVDDSIVAGAGTRIWQFASVTRGTILGKNCSVSPFAMLDGSVYGDNVIISGHVAAGAGFSVGSNVFLGPGVLLVNDMYPAANKEGYDDATLRGNQKFAVVIEDGAMIGGHAVIMAGVRIGKGALVSAGSVVDRDVPDGTIWMPNGYIRFVPPDWQFKRMRWVN